MAIIDQFDGLMGKFGTILIDPPWENKLPASGDPGHEPLARFDPLSINDLAQLPVGKYSKDKSHVYLWCPNRLLPDALMVMNAWGFSYKTSLVWVKINKSGRVDQGNIGYYFRDATELLLFGIKGNLHTSHTARTQENLFASRSLGFSPKPTFVREIIERCSPGPYLELFARGKVDGWTTWDHQWDG